MRVVGLLLLGVWLTVPIAGAAVAIAVPASTKVAPGDTFTLPITLTNVSGLVGYYIELDYSAELDFLGVQNGLLAAAWPAPVFSGIPGRCTLAGYGTTPIAGTGTLLALQFHVKDTAPVGQVSAFHFRNAELNDGAIAIALQDGELTITHLAVIHLPESITRNPGDEFIVPVELIEAETVVGFIIEVNYDASVIALLNVAPGTLPSGWGMPTVNNQSAGRIIIGGWGAQPINSATTLVNLHFQVRPEAPPDTQSYIDLPSAELNDGAIPVVTGNTRVNIANPTTVPVSGVWFLFLLLISLGTLCVRRTARP